MKTGLKIINILIKCLTDIREEELTENLIFTVLIASTQIKLELDCKKNKDETRVYCLSKINFVKLANPSVNNSLKGINKNNIWFVNLLNMLQNSQEQENFTANLDDLTPLSDNLDRFVIYLKETIFSTSSRFYGLISLSNKMSSNECLTGLLFGNHLKHQIVKPKRFFIDLPKV